MSNPLPAFKGLFWGKGLKGKAGTIILVLIAVAAYLYHFHGIGLGA